MAMSRDDSDASGGVFNHPLFPAGGNSRAGSFEEPFGRKQRETRGVNQPFWSVMTQPSGSPLQTQGSDNVNRRSQPSNDGLDFEAIKEEIKSKFQRMQESGNGRSIGSDQNTNEKQVASFEYNHGKRIGGGPIRFPGVQKPFRQGPNQGMGPKALNALMEVTIPNPAALFHKFNEKTEGESKSGSVRKEVPTDATGRQSKNRKGGIVADPQSEIKKGGIPADTQTENKEGKIMVDPQTERKMLEVVASPQSSSRGARIVLKPQRMNRLEEIMVDAPSQAGLGEMVER
ncbi:hypothetical protein BSL78_27009 [Apostichopus japonicus]|uniref:Uncharacterized protein n=1 Tax=Stichopus japonicus TaxID=307972 RepID=A0A2G8JK88_STIJA|nr:hypothetical protein BSL78_27009 [Apostichopus japonicus]